MQALHRSMKVNQVCRDAWRLASNDSLSGNAMFVWSDCEGDGKLRDRNKP